MDSLAELTRDHVEGYLAHLHDYVNPRSGKPLAARTRHVYISQLLQFSRETSQWGWDGPLLSRPDLLKPLPDSRGSSPGRNSTA